MTKLIPFIIFNLIILISCSEKKTDPTPGLIESVSQQNKDDEAAVAKDLSAIGLTYQENYKSYGAAKSLVEVCQEKQLSTLKNSEAKISEMEKSLAPAADLYRENALEFYRKIQDSKKSLNQINSLLQPYCENDHKAAKSCIGDKNSILVHINVHITSFMTVHPILVLNSDKAIGLYLTEQDEEKADYVRSYELKTGVEKQHYRNVLPDVAPVVRLESVFNCLSQAEMKSEIANKIKATARVSFQLGRRECLLIKGQVLAAQRKSKETNTNITFTVSEKDKAFCGDLLN